MIEISMFSTIFDEIVEYGSPEFKTPYFVETDYMEIAIEDLANLLKAVFGFHYEMFWPMSIVLDSYKNSEFPNSLVVVLHDVINYLKNKP